MTTIRSFTYKDSTAVQTDIDIIWTAGKLDRLTGGYFVNAMFATFTTDFGPFDASTSDGNYWLHELIFRHQKEEEGVTGLDDKIRANYAKWQASLTTDMVATGVISSKKNDVFVDVGMAYATRAMKKKISEIME